MSKSKVRKSRTPYRESKHGKNRPPQPLTYNERLSRYVRQNAPSGRSLTARQRRQLVRMMTRASWKETSHG